MAYLVFARKWRPQTFEEVVGQDHITLTLKNAITSGRIAHAYLFTGPRGIGKTSTARIFAKALNCEKGPTPTPCNKCSYCKEITNSTSLDILEIDGASNTSVDQIRDLRENVKLSPSSARFKVYIIDEVHMLSTSAFNALLKTLEEPPAHVKFIFATTQAYKVLPTIISRCQRFDFRRIPIQDIMAKLKKVSKAEGLDIEEVAFFNIASASDGSMRDAESILDQLISYKKGKIVASDVTSLLGMVDTQVYFDFTTKIIKKDAAGILELINHITCDGKDLYQFINGLIEHFRNLIILKVSKELKAIVSQTQDNIKKLIELSDGFSQQELMYSFSVLITTQETMRRSNNMRIPLEVTAVKLTHISELKALPEILNELRGLEKTQAESPKTKPVAHKEKPEDNSLKPPYNIKEGGTNTGDLTKNEMVESNVPQEVSSQWPAFLENIKNESLLVGLYLSEGKIIKVKGTDINLGFHNEANFHIDYLEKKENISLIERKLGELLNKKVKVSLIRLDEGPAETIKEKIPAEEAGSVDPVINSALKIFGGKIVGKG